MEKNKTNWEKIKEGASRTKFTIDSNYSSGMVKGAELGLKLYDYYRRIMFYVFLVGSIIFFILGNNFLAGILIICWHFQTFLNQIYWNQKNMMIK